MPKELYSVSKLDYQIELRGIILLKQKDAFKFLLILFKNILKAKTLMPLYCCPYEIIRGYGKLNS